MQKDNLAACGCGGQGVQREITPPYAECSSWYVQCDTCGIIATGWAPWNRAMSRPAPAITDGMVEDIAGIISDECVVEYTPAVTMYESADPQDADYHIVNSHDVAAKIVSALTAALPHAVDAGELIKQRDNAYWERNRLVALLARMYPSGRAITSIDGWDKEWHNCIYIDTPRGQLSWHVHDNEMVQFASLPEYAGGWDGHTTDEKYRRTLLLLLDLDHISEQGKKANRPTPDAAAIRKAALMEALTPNTIMKAAMIGEFKFTIQDYDPEADGLYVDREVTVPWTTVKEIVAALRETALRALAEKEA